MSLLRNKDLLGKILDGFPPSTVLNMVLEVSHSSNKYDLADLFLEEFDRLDSRVLPVIWKWKSVRSIRGISDEVLDEAILLLMRSAGYVV